MRNRRRFALWMGLAIAAMVGCAPSPPAVFGDDGWSATEHPGTSSIDRSGRTAAPRATPIAPKLRRRWRLADQLDGLASVPGRGRSEHGRNIDRTVAVNRRAAGYLELARDRPLPPGSLIVQRHLPTGGDAVVSYYIMRKLGRPGPTGVWSFTVLDPQLRVAAREPLALCPRCHREAPFDSLFGPPPPPSPMPAASSSPAPAASSSPAPAASSPAAP